MRSVGSISSLRNIETVVGEVCLVTGAISAGDGGPGSGTWLVRRGSYSSEDDDGVSVVVPDGANGTYAWVKSAGINTDDFQSIAALRSDATSVSGSTRRVAHHTTAGDGGGGTFLFVSGAAAGTYTDDGGVTVVPTGGDGSAAWIRQFTGAVHVSWFGPDGVDDGAAIQAAVDYAISRGDTGGCEVVFEAGRQYVVVTPITIQITDSVVTGIKLKGVGGGYPGEPATWIEFTPSSSATLFTFKSAIQCGIEDLGMVAGNANAVRLIDVDAWDSPVFSSFQFRLTRCGLRSFSGVTGVELLWLRNAILCEISDNWFSGTDNLIRLGDDTDPLTEAGGGCATCTWERNQFYCDVEISQCREQAFLSNVFARVNATTPIKFYTHATEFASQKDMIFENNSQVSSTDGVEVTFWQQGSGTGNTGLIARNNRLDGYKLTWHVNGGGDVDLTGNRYDPPASVTGVKGVQLDANAGGFRFKNENYDALTSGGFVYVDDNRTTSPLVVDEALASDYTFTANATYETVLSASSVVFPGGYVRISYTIAVENNQSANPLEWIFRVRINGATVSGLTTLHQQVTGTAHDKVTTLTCSKIVKVDGTPAGVTVELEGRQSGSTTLSTVLADGAANASHLQIESLGI